MEPGMSNAVAKYIIADAGFDMELAKSSVFHRNECVKVKKLLALLEVEVVETVMRSPCGSVCKTTYDEAVMHATKLAVEKSIRELFRGLE